MQVRNLTILVVCQMISTTGSIVMVTLGGIIGATLATNKALATSVIGLQGHTYLHYWWALVLLGIGWNFLYVGGTTLLTYTYSMTERFHAQAVNEFMVFGTSATASLLAGTVMYFFGWTTLMWVPIPALIGICIALAMVRKDPLLERRVQETARQKL